MKPNPFSWTLVLLTAFSAAACGAKSTDDPNNGGRTHWLKACDDDSECGTYQCIAKICTIVCTTDRDCEGHGAPASCVDEVCARGEAPVPSDHDASTGEDGDSCEYDGIVYAHGEDVPLDDCNRCRCDSGQIGCTDRACPEPTPQDNETLCEASGGTWHVSSCGHFSCGQAPLCSAALPGCDCGSENNFVESQGCLPDPTCTEPTPGSESSCQFDGQTYAHNQAMPSNDCNGCVCLNGSIACTNAPCPTPTPEGDEALCVSTGGTWHTTCGHFTCGEPPGDDCVAVGCNCGPRSNFTEANGCAVDPACFEFSGCGDGEAPLNADPVTGEVLRDHCPLCSDRQCSQGCVPLTAWRADTEGFCLIAEETVDCLLPTTTPWPVTGRNSCSVQLSTGERYHAPGGLLLQGSGFAVCPDGARELYTLCDEPLCEATGGSWEPNSCGHYNCGEFPACDAIIPGCNCGSGRNLTENGCAIDTTCAVDCGNLETAYVEQLDAARECQTDDECVALDGSTPLRCWCDLALNRDADLAELSSLGEIVELCFNSLPCECSEPATAPARCIENRCTLVSEGDEALCESTGGTWDPNSCGHYACGAPPACDAIIPGCNCGPDLNFLEGSGCVLAFGCND